MRKEGTIVRWDDAKGFGFVESPQSTAQLFVHVRDWRGSGQPTTGLRVTFEEIHVGGKGPRAMDVQPLGGRTTASPQPRRATRRMASPAVTRPLRRQAIRGKSATPGQDPPAWPALALMLVWLGFLVAGMVLGRLAWMLLPVALVLNLVTFYVYWQDKFAATKGAWRTAERTLHLFGLLGGWPGAWFAHQILRHKSSKRAFREVYWMTAILNLMALVGWVLWPWLPLAR